MHATSPFRSTAWAGTGPESATSRRRWALLAGILVVPAALVLLGVPSAWPLVAIPIVVSAPLLGVQGLTAAGAASGATVALASGSEAVRGPELAVGLIGFLAAGFLVAVGTGARERELAKASGGAVIDRLTGLHNYGFLMDALPRECRRAVRYEHPLSVIALDIDGFKEFNDQHGHLIGNKMLAAVGDAIGATARRSDLAARFGGEEFVVLVPGPSSEASAAADRLRAAVQSATIETEEGVASVSASAGVAEYDPNRDADEQGVLARADAALYRSKREGRNRTTVDRAPAAERVAA